MNPILTISDLALILLASGQSRRFGNTDKLLTLLNGKPLIAHIAEIEFDEPPAQKLAVIDAQNTEIRMYLEGYGWTCLDNNAPQHGQARSLQIGIEAASIAGVKGALLCLGDMPFITANILTRLIAALGPHDAILCDDEMRLSPPAIFRQGQFDQFSELRGDAGAKQLFKALPNGTTLSLPAQTLHDIDTREDMSKASDHGF